MDSTRLIGGVFALEELNTQHEDNSVWAHWTQGAKTHSLFHNARSALAYLIEQLSPNRLWLPAYCCKEISSLSIHHFTKIDFYPLDAALRPNLDFLNIHTQPNHAVLLINYFGRPGTKELEVFTQQAKHITWIEDCAQAPGLEQKPLGSFRIYSPRKLLGAPDGGLLVDYAGHLSPPELTQLADEPTYQRPAQLRAEHAGKGRNDLWYPAFQHAEAAMRVSLETACSETKHALLSNNFNDICNKRKRNFNHLLTHLAPHAFIREQAIDWAPLGFPVLVNDQDKVLAHLHQRNIFAACHWRELDAPRQRFSQEHTLANSLITLPCDQRYGPLDMERIVSELASVNA